MGANDFRGVTVYVAKACRMTAGGDRFETAVLSYAPANPPCCVCAQPFQAGDVCGLREVPRPIGMREPISTTRYVNPFCRTCMLAELDRIGAETRAAREEKNLGFGF